MTQGHAALEGLGRAARWLDLADLVFDARERASAHITADPVPRHVDPWNSGYVNPSDDPRNAAKQARK